MFLSGLKHEEWLLNAAFFHQLQTISDALQKLSFSGPVKSAYPLTFIELNQVSSNVFSALMSRKTFFYCWFVLTVYPHAVCRPLVLCCTGLLCLLTAAHQRHCRRHWMASMTERMCQWTGWVWMFPSGRYYSQVHHMPCWSQIMLYWTGGHLAGHQSHYLTGTIWHTIILFSF